MGLPIESLTWDENRLTTEIGLRLPKGWKWEVRQGDNLFWVVTLSNDQGEPMLVEAEAVAQLALLNALGWLELRNAGPSRASPWAPRQKETLPNRPHDLLYKVQPIEDPADLDPTEIASVYSRTRKP